MMREPCTGGPAGIIAGLAFSSNRTRERLIRWGYGDWALRGGFCKQVVVLWNGRGR